MEAVYQKKEMGQELFLICKALQTHFKNMPIEIIDLFSTNPVKKACFEDILGKRC